MNAEPAIRATLESAGCCADIRSTMPVSGGCIHTVLRVDLNDGTTVAAKVNRSEARLLFEEEADGLRALAATGVVRVPRPIGIAYANETVAFVVEWMDAAPPEDTTWERFGEDLARLHGCDVGLQFGFAGDNHLGSTPQPNAWCDDWRQFNAEHRLGHQVNLARNAGRLDAREMSCIHNVIERLGDFLPRRPHPSLLHGDLWSGNALCVKTESGARIAMIDPAVSIGDGWADIAMMKLFGGFPASCLESYRRNVPEVENVDTRIAVYQLYHVLNHVNIFGRGYVPQAMTLCDTLL